MRKSIIVMALAMACLGASAQERLFNSASVQSPVINDDGTVTFNLYAPKAVKVEVAGDFLPNSGAVAMKEGRNGVWSYTTDKLAPEMYS